MTSAQISAIESAYGRSLTPYTVPETEEWIARLRDVPDPSDPPDKLKSPLTHRREVTTEENAFVLNELLLTKVDFRYWAERYAWINTEGAGLQRLYPFWESQEFILAEIARLERETYIGNLNDGQLIALLKARQLGGSTLSQCLIAHRAATQDNIFGLIAADVDEQSAYLFDMFERILFHLPWFLRPRALEHTKRPGEMKLDGGTNIWTGAGKSTRGSAGDRGNLSRGKTISLAHLSELSTWEDTEQIQSSLMPTFPRNIRTFVLFESTGRGRYNYWHTLWNQARRGHSRLHPVFIPWYTEPNKYSAPAPPSWSPSSSTLAHARRCEITGRRWIHRTPSLTRDQLYWYEKTRKEHEVLDNLTAFLENYPADDEEAFQYSGKSIFDATVIQRVLDQARPIASLAEVGAHVDIQRT